MLPRDEEAAAAQRLVELIAVRIGGKLHGNIVINTAHGLAKKIRFEHCRDIEVQDGKGHQG